MTPRDYFGIIVRAAGLLTLLVTWYNLLAVVITVALALPYPARPMDPAAPAALLRGLIFQFVGLYLLRGAPALVEMGYPRRLAQGQATEAA